MKKAIFAGFIAAAISCAPALAEPAFTWTGYYIGLNGGYGWGHTKAVESDVAPLIFNITDAERRNKFSTDGALDGLQFGYNWQSANWLTGFETDLDLARIRGNGTKNNLIGGAFPGALTGSSDLEWLGTTRLRLGYLATPDFLLYVTGGAAYGGAKLSGSVVNNFGNLALGAPVCVGPDTCYDGSGTKTLFGWTGGVGIEKMVAANTTFKFEYLYVDLGDSTITAGPTAATTGGGAAKFKFDNISNIVRLGFNWKY